MADSGAGTVKVWDVFVRAFHWLLVLGFAVAYLTEDDALTVHVYAGYAVGLLVAARIAWGFVGPRRARFADFVYAPSAVVAYLRDLLLFRAQRHLGHSPAGGAMVVALLLCLAATVTSGLMVFGAQENAGPLKGWFAATEAPVLAPIAAAHADEGDRRPRQRRSGAAKALKEVHEFLANLALGLVIAHVAGVVLASVVHRENLARAMITGRKRA